MTSNPFTLRSDADLIATFKKQDQGNVVLPKRTRYPLAIEYYHAWTEPSGVYTYLTFKKSNWEIPRSIVFSRNGAGHASSPAGMCDWCHTSGASDEIGLLTTTLTPHSSGGTWLCLDLTCLLKIEEQTGLAGKSAEKRIDTLMKKIGNFFERAYP